MKINQKGFSIIEVSVVVLVIGVIGFAGWKVWESKHALPKESNSVLKGNSSSDKATTEGSLTNGPGADWQTYTNKSAGFSIKVPKQVLSGYGAPCKKSSSVNDGTGKQLSTEVSYRPADGVVPATVVKDGNNYYIGESYTYQVGQSHQTADGYSIYKTCDKVITDTSAIKSYLTMGKDYPMLSLIPLTVAPAKNEAEILTEAKKIFTANSLYVTGLTQDKDGEWKDVGLDCKIQADCELMFNYKFTLRYYEKQHKFVYIALGQAPHLETPDGSSAYDQDVLASFKLLN